MGLTEFWCVYVRLEGQVGCSSTKQILDFKQAAGLFCYWGMGAGGRNPTLFCVLIFLGPFALVCLFFFISQKSMIPKSFQRMGGVVAEEVVVVVVVMVVGGTFGEEKEERVNSLLFYLRCFFVISPPRMGTVLRDLPPTFFCTFLQIHIHSLCFYPASIPCLALDVLPLTLTPT